MPSLLVWLARAGAAVRNAPVAVLSVLVAAVALILAAGLLGAGERGDALVLCLLPLAVLFAVPTEAMVALARIALWGRDPGGDPGQWHRAAFRARRLVLAVVAVGALVSFLLADQVVHLATPGLVDRHDATVAVRWMAALIGLAAIIALVLVARRPPPAPAGRRRKTSIRILGPLLPVARFTVVGGLQVWLMFFFGSWQPAGSIAILGFCLLLAAAPVSLITAATARRLLPELDVSRGFAVREPAPRAALTAALEFSAAWAFPAAGLLIALAGPLVGLLLQQGAFTHADAVLAVPVLRWLSLGVVSWSWCWLLAAPFFAPDAAGSGSGPAARAGRVPAAAVPARTAGLGLFVAACVDVWVLPSLGVRGLAIGALVGSCVLAIVLGLRMRARGIGADLRAAGAISCRCAAAAAAALAVAWLLAWFSEGWLPDLPQLAAIAAAYASVYLGIGAVLRVPDVAAEAARRPTSRRELSRSRRSQ